MKKYIILLILIPQILFSYPIKELPQDLLNTTLLNMQTEDCPLTGDYPKININLNPEKAQNSFGSFGETYYWNLFYENKGQGTGTLSIPIGVQEDTKILKVKYKVNKAENCDIKFGVRYNTDTEYDLDYVFPLGGRDIPKFEKQVTFKTKETNIFTLYNPRHAPHNKGFSSAFYITFTGEGNCDIDIYSVTLINSKEEEFNLFSYDWDMRAYSPPPKAKKDKIPLPENTVYIGIWTPEIAFQEGRERILRLKELIPNLGIDCSSQATALLNFKEFLLQNNIPAYYQTCGAIDIEPAVSENRAHSVHVTGVSRDNTPRYGELHHLHDMTNPIIKEAYKKAVSLLGDYGIEEFQFIDSVWPYWDGNNYGYGEKAISEYRKALKEEDGGIYIKTPNPKSQKVERLSGNPWGSNIKIKNISFWDYLEENCSLRFTPKDLSLNSWDEFVPYPNGFTSEEVKRNWQNKNNLPYAESNKSYFVFNALKRYEYLKHFNDIGIATEHGCNLAVMPNGDNWANANDYIGLMKLAYVKTIIDETRFYHPICTINGYFNLKPWREIAKLYQKHHRIITEIGPGGNGHIYWEPKLSYILQYSIQNIGHYNSMQTDWVYGGINENSDTVGRSAWVDFLCKAYGYNDATEDNGEQPKSDIIYLSAPMGLNAFDNQRSMFNLTDTDFGKMAMDYRAFDILKPKPKLMILNAINTPKSVANNLSFKVLKEKMNILLNGYLPGVETDGENWTNYWYDAHKINNPHLFNSLIGEVKKEEDIDTPFYKGEYYTISKSGITVIEKDNIPVLTKIKTTGGNVYYYHLNAGINKELDTQVLDFITNDLKIQKESVSENAYTFRFKLKNGAEAVILFNKSIMTNTKWPNVEFNYYKIKAEGAYSQTSVKTQIKDYIIYDFLNEKILDVSNNQNIKIEMKDLSANIYFIIPKGKEAFTETLKNRLNKINIWYDKFDLGKL